MKKHLLIQRGFACDPATGFWFNSFTRKGINEAAIRKAPIEYINSWVLTAIPIGLSYDLMTSPAMTSEQMGDIARQLGW